MKELIYELNEDGTIKNPTVYARTIELCLLGDGTWAGRVVGPDGFTMGAPDDPDASYFAQGTTPENALEHLRKAFGPALSPSVTG